MYHGARSWIGKLQLDQGLLGHMGHGWRLPHYFSFALCGRICIIDEKMILGSKFLEKGCRYTDLMRCWLMFFKFIFGTWFSASSSSRKFFWISLDVTLAIENSTLMLPGSIIECEAVSTGSRPALCKDSEQVKLGEGKKTLFTRSMPIYRSKLQSLPTPSSSSGTIVIVTISRFVVILNDVECPAGIHGVADFIYRFIG